YQHLLRLGDAELPWATGVLDAGERAGARAAVEARDQDVVGVGLGDARRNGADASFGNELHADTSAWVDALQVVDQLGKVLDGINIVVRRWRDQARPGHRVPQAGDQVGHLVRRQLATFARFAALRHLDFH